jgi:hypothetical protein
MTYPLDINELQDGCRLNGVSAAEANSYTDD